MSSRFKPLLAPKDAGANPSCANFHPKILPASSAPAPAFKSWTPDPKEPPVSPGRHDEASPAQATKPSISLQRQDDGRIIGIRVQCSCGHIMELACHYPPESTSPPDITPSQ